MAKYDGNWDDEELDLDGWNDYPEGEPSGPPSRSQKETPLETRRLRDNKGITGSGRKKGLSIVAICLSAALILGASIYGIYRHVKSATDEKSAVSEEATGQPPAGGEEGPDGGDGNAGGISGLTDGMPEPQQPSDSASNVSEDGAEEVPEQERPDDTVAGSDAEQADVAEDAESLDIDTVVGHNKELGITNTLDIVDFVVTGAELYSASGTACEITYFDTDGNVLAFDGSLPSNAGQVYGEAPLESEVTIIDHGAVLAEDGMDEDINMAFNSTSKWAVDCYYDSSYDDGRYIYLDLYKAD